MSVVKTIRPGQPGAKKYQEQWGDRLVAVRYRHDKPAKQRYVTIEIIIEAVKATKPQSLLDLLKVCNVVVGVKLNYQEMALRYQLKKYGAHWSNQQRLWFIRYENAERLRLTDRIVVGATEKCLDVDMSLL